MSTKLYVDTMTSDKLVRRRRYGDDLEVQVLTECDAPGASVAKVAMAHGINANVVHRWRQLAREGGQATVTKPREFVPVAIAAPTPLPVQSRRDIEVELRRGAVTMKVLWPSSAAADFAAWTREMRAHASRAPLRRVRAATLSMCGWRPGEAAFLPRLHLPQRRVAPRNAPRRLPRRRGLNAPLANFAAKVSRQRCRSTLRGFRRLPCFDSARTLIAHAGWPWSCSTITYLWSASSVFANSRAAHYTVSGSVPRGIDSMRLNASRRSLTSSMRLPP